MQTRYKTVAGSVCGFPKFVTSGSGLGFGFSKIQFWVWVRVHALPAIIWLIASCATKKFSKYLSIFKQLFFFKKTEK
jgi:hypothetical protein